MTHTTHAVRITLTASLVLLALGAVAVPAGAAPPDAAPANWLYVTVTQGDARSGDTRGTLLLCDPPQGHARAVRACTQLREAAGDITRIPHEDAYCPMLYAPVTASARGEWDGRPVEYTQTFPSDCAMTAATGAVFALTE